MFSYFASFIWSSTDEASRAASAGSDDASQLGSTDINHNDYFFAKNYAISKNDLRHLAARYHKGLRQRNNNNNTTSAGGGKIQQSGSTRSLPEDSPPLSAGGGGGARSSALTGPRAPQPLCKICSSEPATLFAAELSGIFLNSNDGAADPLQRQPPMLCFECFVLAFRAFVLPEVATAQRQQGIDHLVLKKIEEAAIVDSVIVPGSKHKNSAGSNSSSASSLQQGSMTPNSKQRLPSPSSFSEKDGGGAAGGTLLCVRCKFPCSRDVAWCPACGTATPWSIACKACLCPAFQAPPICVKTGRAHLQWECEACTFSNTLDTPECDMCKTVRAWNCPRCDAQQRSRRSNHGERCCNKCGYRFTEMSVTTVRRFGLDETSVRQADKAMHETERAAFKVDTRVAELLKGNGETQLRLKRVAMDGDGNCAFRAISFCLFNTPLGHMLVRRAVVFGLQSRKEELLPWFEDAVAFSGYCNLMEQSGTWADEMALRVAAQVFGVHLHILSSDDVHWHFNFSPFPPGASSDGGGAKKSGAGQHVVVVASSKDVATEMPRRPHIFLSYAAPVHYDALLLTTSAPQSNAVVPACKAMPTLLRNLAESFVKEEDEWVDV